MKVKLGTQLEEEVYSKLKVKAAREKRTITDVIQEALLEYMSKDDGSVADQPGLNRLLESPSLVVDDESFREIMEADFYEQ